MKKTCLDTNWIALRACVMSEQNNICAMCHNTLKDSEFTVHHIIPRAEGGKDVLGNLIGLCNTCHEIAEEEKLSRYSILNYFNINVMIKNRDNMRKGYFINKKQDKGEFEYPEIIILNKESMDLKRKELVKLSKDKISFNCEKKFKDRAINAGQKYKINGIPMPVKLSMFCRIAVANLMYDIENINNKKGE